MSTKRESLIGAHILIDGKSIGRITSVTYTSGPTTHLDVHNVHMCEFDRDQFIHAFTQPRNRIEPNRLQRRHRLTQYAGHASDL